MNNNIIITTDVVKTPKILVIKLEDRVVHFYYEGRKIGSSSAGLMERYLKDDVQELQDQYHFDILDIDPQIDMSLLHGIK